MTQCHTGGLGGDDIVPREHLNSERGKKVWSDAGVHLDSAACRVSCNLGQMMTTHKGIDWIQEHGGCWRTCAMGQQRLQVRGRRLPDWQCCGVVVKALA